ncbi:MAG: DUF2071 domain-containing protein [Phaeodactylibacter sp.]|nr:DUF2071 domain-containing protein [Phaeodactylibacter sp.]
MSINEILNITEHRPWGLPAGPWKYYQEWNRAVFLHWQVDEAELKRFVPAGLEADLYEGRPWVSLVAFTMENIRPRYLPPFPPVSDFHEINIRTYVRYNGRPGVYFLSIEGGSALSCRIAKGLSELPYRYSKMKRQENAYVSTNTGFEDTFELRYRTGPPLAGKTPLDKWLTERYALFQDAGHSINEFETHHVEWPVCSIGLERIRINYPRFGKLLSDTPGLSHYSTGVQVIAWGKKKYKERAS